MNKKILFRIGTITQHKTRFGETADLYKACYFRGKELGYEDGSIYFEWPLKVPYSKRFDTTCYLDQDKNIVAERIIDSFQCPTYSILPIEFIKHSNVDESEFDEIINLIEPGAFYDGSPPLYTGLEHTKYSDRHKQKKNYEGHWNYLNKYYIDTGKRPIFNIPRDRLNKPYILFHIRIASWSEYRNPNLKIFLKIFKLLKRSYGDKYEIWKCGESSEETVLIDKMADKIVPYQRDLNEFIKLINNASLFVCTNSGPQTYGMMLGVPILELDSPREGRREGSGGFHTSRYWKEKNSEYGETAIDWLDKRKIKVCFKGDALDNDDILKFVDRILKYDYMTIITAIPKSASSSFRNVLSELLDRPYYKDLDVSTNVWSYEGCKKTGDIAKFHYYPNEKNIEYLYNNRIKYIIILRNPKDQLPAMYCTFLDISSRKHDLIIVDGKKRLWDAIYHIDTSRIKGEANVENGLNYLINGGYLTSSLSWMNDWIIKRDKNLSIIIKYEDIINKFNGTMINACTFLNHHIDKDSDTLYEEHNKFKIASHSKMKMRVDNYPYGWTGKIGIWKDYFSEDNIKNYNDAIRKFMTDNPNQRLSDYYELMINE